MSKVMAQTLSVFVTRREWSPGCTWMYSFAGGQFSKTAPSEGLPLPTNTSRLLASEPGLTPTGPLSAFSLKQRTRCWFGA